MEKKYLVRKEIDYETKNQDFINMFIGVILILILIFSIVLYCY